MTRLMVLDLNAGRLPQREPYRCLAARGLEVLLLAPEVWQEPFGSVAFEEEVPQRHYRAQALPVLFKGRYHRVIFRGFKAAAAAFQPDELWVHAEPENWLAWQALRVRASVCPQARLNLVSWRNIDYPRRGLPYRLAWLHQAIEDRSRREGVRVLCYNSDAQRILGAKGFDCAPTRMGVNLDYFKPGDQRRARQALGLPEKARLAGFAGRFIEAKGGADLIDAAARVPGLQLLFLGDGPQRAAWAQRAESKGVTLHWRTLPHERMPQGLQAMDLLTLPSRSRAGWREQFGRILVEAMACGVPVLGSDSGAIPEVIGRWGLVFPEGDVAALSRGLREALRRRAALARAGRIRAAQYEWKVIAPELARQFSRQRLGPTVAVHGVPVFAGKQAQALTAFEALLKGRRGGTLFYLNAHTANVAASDAGLRRDLCAADLVLPDGGGVLLASRWLGQPIPERLALGDLLQPLVRLAHRHKAKLWFWGGEDGVARAAAMALGVPVAGACHGFQRTEAEIQALFNAIRRSGSKVVFIGLGSPRQETLARRLVQAIPGVVAVVCGNAFVFAAGLQKRAPQWMQATHLEWLWRIWLEPRRLWRRYFFGNARFVIRTAWQVCGGRP